MRVWKGRMIANQWSALTVFKQELTPLYPTPTDNSQAKGHLSWGQRALPLRWSERRCYGNGTGWSVARWGGGMQMSLALMWCCLTCFKLHSWAEGEHFSGWGLVAHPAQFTVPASFFPNRQRQTNGNRSSKKGRWENFKGFKPMNLYFTMSFSTSALMTFENVFAEKILVRIIQSS